MPANIFEPTANGYAGRVRLFGIDEAIALVAIEPGDGENTPAYRIHLDDEDGTVKARSEAQLAAVRRQGQ